MGRKSHKKMLFKNVFEDNSLKDDEFSIILPLESVKDINPSID